MVLYCLIFIHGNLLDYINNNISLKTKLNDNL